MVCGGRYPRCFKGACRNGWSGGVRKRSGIRRRTAERWWTKMGVEVAAAGMGFNNTRTEGNDSCPKYGRRMSCWVKSQTVETEGGQSVEKGVAVTWHSGLSGKLRAVASLLKLGLLTVTCWAVVQERH